MIIVNSLCNLFSKFLICFYGQEIKMQLDILLKWNSLIILVEKNEAASDKRSTERVIGIVARDLRNTRYGVCFLAENELSHVLRKSLAKYSPFQILYQT